MSSNRVIDFLLIEWMKRTLLLVWHLWRGALPAWGWDSSLPLLALGGSPVPFGFPQLLPKPCQLSLHWIPLSYPSGTVGLSSMHPFPPVPFLTLSLSSPLPILSSSFCPLPFGTRWQAVCRLAYHTPHLVCGCPRPWVVRNSVFLLSERLRILADFQNVQSISQPLRSPTLARSQTGSQSCPLLSSL